MRREICRLFAEVDIQMETHSNTPRQPDAHLTGGNVAARRAHGTKSTRNTGRIKFDQLGKQPQLTGEVGWDHDFAIDLPKIAQWRTGL